jgi:spectrin beta
LELLRARRHRLELSQQLQYCFQEMDYMLDSMEELKRRLRSPEFGKHLLGAQELLQKHSLLEADINVLGDHVKQASQSGRQIERRSRW